MNKLIKDVITEADNETYDAVRVGGLFIVAYYLFLLTLEILSSCENVSVWELSQGVALVLASLGGGIGFKYSQEKRN